MLVHLLEAALRSLALGSAVWLSLWILRVQHPQIRMTAWTVVLVASLAMPVLMHRATLTVPIHSLLLPEAAIAPAAPAAPKPATAPGVGPEAKTMGLPSAVETTSAAARFRPSQRGSPRTAIAAPDWQMVALSIYLAVGLGLLLRLALGLALTWQMLRKGQRLDEEWTAGADVRLSAAVATPVTFGTTIMLPADCRDWSPAKRQAVLAHERSHVARADFHVLLLATLHRTLFWFSPFSWWLLNELAETAELVSDDAAIETLGDRARYAEILIDIAQSARPIGAGIAMARTRSAVKRVEHILATTMPPPRRLGRCRRALILAGLSPLVALATVSLSRSFPSETKLVKVTYLSPGQTADASPIDDGAAELTAAPPRLWISRIASVGNFGEDMFSPDADWKNVAAHTSAVQFPPGAFLNRKDDDLQRAFRNLAARHISLALELRVLVRTDQCPQMTRGYANAGDVEKILDRIHRLGGDLKYVVLDDPYYFGHRFAGPGACLEPPAALARQIAEKLQIVRTYFPNAQIGTAELVDESSAWIDELVEWVDVFQSVTGEPLAFFHADVGWSRAAVRNLAPLQRALKARNIPFGIIYNADDSAQSDETWIDSTRQHIADIETSLGIHPDAAIFRSWAPYPTRLLPESQPGTLTNLAAQYLLPRPSLTLTRDANVLSGRMVDAQGRPIASAPLTVDALDVAGSMDLVERHIAGKVPPNATTAMMVVQVHMGGACACAGRFDASLGSMRYYETSTGRHEEISPFPAAAGNAPAAVRVMQFAPGQAVNLALRSFPVTAGADYALDVPLAVSANGERAGYVALVFRDGAGRWMRLDKVWLRPSERSLGHAVTKDDGRFQMDLPPAVAQAGEDVRVYFPGSAALESQTATYSQQGQF